MLAAHAGNVQHRVNVYREAHMACRFDIPCSFQLDLRGLHEEKGVPVAQWVKRGPSSIPARGEIFSTENGVPLHTTFYYQPPIVLI